MCCPQRRNLSWAENHPGAERRPRFLLVDLGGKHQKLPDLAVGFVGVFGASTDGLGNCFGPQPLSELCVIESSSVL